MTSTTLIKNKVLYFICALIKDPAFAAAVLDNLEEDGDRKLGTHFYGPITYQIKLERKTSETWIKISLKELFNCYLTPIFLPISAAIFFSFFYSFIFILFSRRAVVVVDYD